jgi:hypothetical protein
LNRISLLFNLAVFALVAAALAYGYFGYVNAPSKEALTRFHDSEVTLSCQLIAGDDTLIVELTDSNQSYQVKGCADIRDSYTTLMASVHDGELWELHINGFQKVRYERTRVKPIFFSFFFLYFIIPMLLIRASLVEMQTGRKINEKDAAASLLMGVGLGVILLMELSGSVIGNVLSGFTGLLFTFGIYSLLKKLRQHQTGTKPDP